MRFFNAMSRREGREHRATARLAACLRLEPILSLRSQELGSRSRRFSWEIRWLRVSSE
jgi:hypothetical protein